MNFINKIYFIYQNKFSFLIYLIWIINILIYTCSNKCMLALNRQNIPYRSSMSILLRISFKKRIPAAHGAFFFQSGCIVNVNYCITASCIEVWGTILLPLGVTHAKLYFGDWDYLFQIKWGCIPKIDGKVIRTCSN